MPSSSLHLPVVRAGGRFTALVAGIALSLATVSSPASASTAYDAAVDLTFPVAGPSTFQDDYDACRSGCSRRHLATDVMAPYGAKVHAAVGGTVSFITGIDSAVPAYGYMIRIKGDDGRVYSYIHLGHQDRGASEAYAPGIRKGVRVERGQHIGTNGCSGNASCSGPHLHFEIEDARVEDPYGTNRMNPYASLVSARKRGDTPENRAAASKPSVLVGDWDGSGTDGIGWWHEGRVRLRTAAGEVIEFRYGRVGDVPLAGDWDGDGRTTLGIVRDGAWHLKNALQGGDADHTFTYGRVSRGDVPIAGDWDGNGVQTPGIIRDGEWHLRNTHAGGPGDHVFTYGRITRGDRPLVGDWTHDGVDLPGIVREREWHLRFGHAGGIADLDYIYGRVTAGDVPAMGDWNGDGIDTPAIVRDGVWHLKYEHSGGDATEQVTFSAP